MRMLYNKLGLYVLGLTLGIVTAPAWAMIVNTTVDARQTVHFAGYQMFLQPLCIDGFCSSDALNPSTYPNAIDITGFGNSISVSANGSWSHAGAAGGISVSGPEGRSLTEKTSLYYELTGISLLEANLNMLVGVFLSDLVPIPASGPASLSAVLGDDMSHPLLHQAFAIGANLENIIIPTGATRLYLGMHDGFQWGNNSGSVAVQITSAATTPEPSTLGLLAPALLGFVLLSRRRAS